MSSELFSLSMGKMEDQIDLFQFENAMVERANSITMRDGWFYVANGSAGKIMVFSSYGDLIFLLYNPQTNPAPTTRLRTRRNPDAAPRKRARAASSPIPSPTSGTSRWRATVPCTWKTPSPTRRRSRTRTAG